MISKGRVILGMSGGVDSSTAGLLLKYSGYEVIGVMLRTWRFGQQPDRLTPGEQELFDSTKKITDAIGIQFEMVDARGIFEREVIQYFIESYSSGLTPNPCMRCNRDVKWKILLELANVQGARWVSTGHYARLFQDRGEIQLRKAKDPAKDQTYFLSHLTSDTLQRTLFPLGEYLKDEVRQIARENHIEAVNRPESQDLCFLEGTDYRSFILSHQPDAFTPGEIVDMQGNLLGTHSGLANYTIGQRKGLGVFLPQPLYVARKDISLNRLVIGCEDQMGTNHFKVAQINWISGSAPAVTLQVKVKIRYQAKPIDATITHIHEGTFEVTTSGMLRDVTPGQFAVFYEQDLVLGGGTIAPADFYSA